jgi:hypothetical protein
MMKHPQYIACKRDGTFEFRNGEPVLKQEGDVAIFNCEDSLPLDSISTYENFFYVNVKEDNVAWDEERFNITIDKVKELNKV